MCLSLLVHGGIVSAVYALRHEAKSAPGQISHERALEIEIVREPEIEAMSVPAPVVAKAAEIPKNLPPPPPPPEIEPAALAVAEVLAPVKNQELEAAPPIPAKAVELETKTVSLLVQVEAVSPPTTVLGGGVPADYLLNPKPVYPVEARRRREEGVVVLAVQVNREGFPNRIQIVQSSRFQMLDEAAIRAVNQWRFTPARLGKLAVASQIQVPIRFKLSDSKSDAP